MRHLLPLLVTAASAANETQVASAPNWVLTCHDCLFAIIAGSVVLFFGLVLCYAKVSVSRRQRETEAKLGMQMPTEVEDRQSTQMPMEVKDRQSTQMAIEVQNRHPPFRTVVPAAMARQEEPYGHASGNTPPNAVLMQGSHCVPRNVRSVPFPQKQQSWPGARLPPLERRPCAPSALSEEVGAMDPRYLGGWGMSRQPSSKRQVVPVRVAPLLSNPPSCNGPRT